ncbi:MAG: isopeptide-forming domain-containing fimbrial protein [Ruminococcus sp.]|nr:isopeptide-forming domain-containing fimbrial protein [Ruminococcus sp.]
MRKLKRITALILSVLMLMPMSVAVSATDYTLYISNDVDGYVYTAYQIFSGEMGKDADDNEVLKVPEWSTGIDTTDIYTELAKLTLSDGTTKPFTFADGSELTSAAEVAAKLAQYTDTYDSEVAQLFADFIDDYVVGITTSFSSGSTSSSGYYTISATAGYYLIKNTTVPSDGSATRYILAMTSTTLKGSEASLTGSLEAKSDLPHFDKDLDKTDANIEDTITYYLTASLPTDYDSYSTYKLIFHDTPSDGLTYNAGSVKVYVYTSKADATAHTNGTQVYTGDYAVSPDTEGATSFTVTISDTKSLTTDGTTAIATDSSSLIQVEFTATLNEEAIIGGNGNPDEAYLEYSNDMYGTGTGESIHDIVITWTYELDVTKVDEDEQTKTLDGAQFVLYRLNDSGEKEYVIVDSDNKVDGWDTDKTKASTLESNSGVFSVIGLDVGTYYLEETKAPSGYNKMSDVVKIVIAAEHSSIEGMTEAEYADYLSTYAVTTYTWLTDDALKLDDLTITMTIADKVDGPKSFDTTGGTVSITVTNNTGAALPSTGGIGTTIFYIVGGVLVVGAIILLITKKRMGGDDK